MSAGVVESSRKMPNAPATGLSSLKLGLDSTPQVYAYTPIEVDPVYVERRDDFEIASLHHKSTPTSTEVDPVYVEKRDNFEIASAGTQCRRFKSPP
ncbi:hypothetical protein THAOC_12445 [Thalassiosira oceanica]|uniref:Uncharacterized protein n=1 Tax=Thalassiosira oceanica TaxID=159749 RepID=K0SK30_THAOC|nr:hypothetical protein THAOC_12445 [Thalassiosira oceanica]|eukprot:EJK66623.1 hypothetical protein THAOC_12445 [Thalassiosira oceanica]